MRKLGIAAFSILILSIGLFLYSEYDLRKFEEGLSPSVLDTSATEAVRTATSTQAEERASETQRQSATEAVRTAKDAKDATPALESLTTETQGLIVNEDALYDEESSEFLRQAIAFNFTDRQQTYERLKTLLTERHGDDARVSEFLTLWNQMTGIVGEMKSYGIEGSDVDAFLDLAPDLVIDDYLEQSLDLLEVSEETATHLRADVEKWVDKVYRLEIANAALPLVQEAIIDGDMTVEEAKAFFKELSGFDTDIVVEEIPE